MAPAIVDLPQPDSPASPMTCPRSTAMVTPRTAGTGPPLVWYVIRKIFDLQQAHRPLSFGLRMSSRA